MGIAVPSITGSDDAAGFCDASAGVCHDIVCTFEEAEGVVTGLPEVLWGVMVESVTTGVATGSASPSPLVGTPLGDFSGTEKPPSVVAAGVPVTEASMGDGVCNGSGMSASVVAADGVDVEGMKGSQSRGSVLPPEVTVGVLPSSADADRVVPSGVTRGVAVVVATTT